MEKLIIDRIENDTAVCERQDRSHCNIPLEKLYPGAKEGDYLIFANGEYRRDLDGETTARNRNRKLQDNLFEE